MAEARTKQKKKMIKGLLSLTFVLPEAPSLLPLLLGSIFKLFYLLFFCNTSCFRWLVVSCSELYVDCCFFDAQANRFAFHL